MKNYNKQIQITVELDFIAQSLHSVMNHEFKHCDIVVEAIIGRLDANNDTVGMTALYNALNGFTNDVNFTVGDIVNCSKKEWAYWTQESIENDNTVQREIGQCEVIEVNPYSDKKIKIRFSRPGKSVTSDSEMWVEHSTCKRISVESPELMA